MTFRFTNGKVAIFMAAPVTIEADTLDSAQDQYLAHMMEHGAIGHFDVVAELSGPASDEVGHITDATLDEEPTLTKPICEHLTFRKLAD